MKAERRSGSIAYMFALSGVKPQRWYASIALSVIGILAESVPFIAIYFIIRHVLEAMSLETGIVASYLWGWGAFTAAALVLSVVCTLLGGYGAHKSAYTLIYGLRKQIITHLGRLPMGYFSETSTGEIQKQMESGMGKIEQLLAHNLPNLVGAGPLVLALLISMFMLNGWLALAVLIPIVAAYFIQGLVMNSKKSRQSAVEGSQRMGEMNKWFNEYLRGIAVVKVFGDKQLRFEKLEDSINRYLQYLLNFTKRTAMPFNIFKVLMLSVLSFVMPVATLLISIYGGDMQLVLTILMFLIITPCLYSPVMELMRLGTETQQANVAIDQIETLMETQPLPKPTHTKIPERFDVSFEKVSFSYQSASNPMRRWALQDLSFHVQHGSVTALVGPSGGGKSTAGQLLCRFWDVSQGSIRIGEIDIRDMALENLMDIIAIVFQDTYIFASSVYENITMNRPAERSKVEAAARAAQIHDFIMTLPHGYETKLGDGGHHLSGGEAQRIAIARAILKDSPIVVLDEATAHTDADNETLIQQAMNRLLQGKTVIIIAHRLATVMNADQILVLRDGQLMEQGDHHSLMAKNGLYLSLWDIQNRSDDWSLGKSSEAKGGTDDAEAIL